MAGIVGGLEDVLGLNTNAGTAELQQAIQALRAVGVPNAAQLTLPELQKYVVAGILSPQQYQAISENPEAYQQAFQAAQDTTGTEAQKAALQELGGVVNAGGSTAINRANLLNNINTTNQAMKAARQGIMENAQERGVAGGGLEFINQLANEQGNSENANMGAVNTAANNAQLALQAMTQGGQLGGQLQGQSNQTAEAKAQAAADIARYNSALQSAANQYNTQNANTAQAENLANAQGISNQNTGLKNFRTQYNAQIPEEIFQNQLTKAGAVAGGYGNMANLKEQQATNQNQFIGGLLGAGATLGGDYLMGNAMRGNPTTAVNGSYPGMDTTSSDYTKNAFLNNPNGYAMGGEVCYAQGGEVHDHALCMKAGGNIPGEAKVPGDSTQNDTIPAMLSPHEIVLPRTVSQAPNAPQAASKFVAGIKGQGQVKDFATVLKELEENGLELRLCAKGY